MKKITLIFVLTLPFFLTHFSLNAQDLPKHMTEEERLAWPAFYEAAMADTRVVSPPPGQVRAPGEWEEMYAICITWRSYPSILAEVVRHAQQECKVIINCNSSNTSQYPDSNAIKTYLTNAGVPLTSNIVFNVAPSNSVWHRDYGSYTVYQNDVEDRFLIDWKYNRSQRPEDDVLPLTHATLLGLPIYECSANPYLLIHTGGNLMFDGFGTAMSSELVVDENSSLTVAQIDNRMNQFFGTDRYIKFDVLPYDGIHHIDMHMKLLDEETLLLGEYPPGISDGPQIEANLAWLQANYNSVYGTPYRIVRIPMPSNATGTSWPSTGAYYRTYTNGVFVNKTFIYPTYYTQYDTIADRILREALPGYKLVGIDSDDGGSQSPIAASGSIHCITSNIWVADPLLISHQRLRDTDDLGPYQVDALIQHRTGIASATLYHTTDTSSGYTPVPMTLTNTVNHTWTGSIPAYPAGSEVFYYIGATSVSNKTQVRPITAPDGFWKFDISVIANIPHSERTITAGLGTPYPNPARAITCVPVEAEGFINCNLSLYDINGRLVETLHEGQLQPGTNNFFFNAMNMEAGVYFLRLETDHDVQAKRVLVYGY